MPWPRKSKEPSFFASASNTSMNAAPMALRFCFGIGHAGQPRQEQVGGVGEDQRQVQPLEPLSGSAPLRPAASRRCRRRCTSAGRRSRDGSAPPRPSNRRRRSGRRPRGRRPPARGSAPSPPRRTTPSSSRRCSRRRRRRSCAGSRGRGRCARPRDGTAARRGRGRRAAIAATGALALVAVTVKPAGRRLDEVAVARPHAQVRRDRGEERRVRIDGDRRQAELAVRRRRHLAAERVGHQLHAVADAEHRHARRRRRRCRSAARRRRTRSWVRPTG